MVVSFLLLPATIFDTPTRPVDFDSDHATINNRSFTLYRARTPEQWQQGFKGRDVGRGEAMLFEFPRAGWRMFWMKDTTVPLDLVFLDGGFHVVKVFEDAQPCRFLCKSYIARAHYVLEFRAGVARELGLVEGSKITLSTFQKPAPSP